MMTLLYKELRLCAHPTSVVFAFLGCLVLVPAYPYSVIFLFGCLAPYITFVNARETNDAWYTATLPVTKRESVRAKCLLIVSLQLFQLLFSIPFTLLRRALGVPNNPVGLDATLAWYGFGLMIYAAFDLAFFPAFYKSGYKAGKAFIVASVPHAAGDDHRGKHRAYPGACLAGQRCALAEAAAGAGGGHGLLRGPAAAGLPDLRRTL